MKLPNIDHILHWWTVNIRDLLRIVFILLAGLIIVMYMGLFNGQARQSRENTRILQELSRQSKQRDKNVSRLISDNAQQTIILCTLIIGDSNGLTNAQVTSIETICNQQIKQISDGLGASTSDTSVGTTHNSTDNQSGTSSSPQSAPNITPTQGQASQPSGDNNQSKPIVPLNCKINVLGIKLGCN